MKRIVVFSILLASLASAHSSQLSCRTDSNNKEAVCYEKASVRVNGHLRSFAMASGGPKGVIKSPYTAVVFCPYGYMELRNKLGVVMARNFPQKSNLRYLVSDVCKEVKTKPDKTLK